MLGGTRHHIQCTYEIQGRLNFLGLDNVLLFRGARMIVQLVGLLFAISICFSCASSAVQAGNLDQSTGPAQSQSPESANPASIPSSTGAPNIGTAAASGNLPIKYWGNSFSLKFHRPSCPFAKAMSAHHVMFFNFRKQAIDSGQVPCRYCLPPNWTTVRATILDPADLSKIHPSRPESNVESAKAPAIPTQPRN